MPRQKGQTMPGKATAAKPERRTRTTDPDERIALVDAKIAQLTSLIAERKALIEKTEATVAKRKEALAKTENMLKNAYAKKERIIASKNTAPKAVIRAAKRAEQEKVAALMDAIAASGKSIDEVLAELSEQA